jgi:putative DNA primase/helicase
MIEYEVKALEAIRSKLEGYPSQIIMDNKHHHFHTGSSDKKNKSGWYIFAFDSDYAYGAFGDFRTGETHGFCSKNTRDMTNDERIKFKEKQKKQEAHRKRELEKIKKETAVKAAKLCDKAVINNNHSYLIKKKIKNYSNVGVAYGCLIIPAYRDGEIASAQMISLDSKKFLTGAGASKDTYHVIGNPNNADKIAIVEGYATGASIHEATGLPVVVAFGTSGLPAVTKYVRKKNSNALLIICADNDESEAGINAAQNAIKGVSNAIIRLCPINTDFNDLHCEQGLQAVRDVIFPPAPKSTPEPEQIYVASKSNKIPFKILGRHAKKCYYMLADGQIYDFSPASHNKQVLIALAPYDFWVDMYPSDKGGIATDEAVSWLLRQSEQMDFETQYVRGRGAWLDNERIIVHQGNNIYDVTNSEEYETDLFETDFLYPRGSSIAAKKTKPLSDENAKKIINIFNHLPTENLLQAYLLAGWIACSQISGVLDWRPHVWLTGSKSAGKSWVVSKIMKPLMGKNVLFVQSSTTEAGIRQSLKADTLPVLFDEAEGNSERSRGNIQRVLELARQASSSDGGMIAKGTTNGDAMEFLIRSCFCFSSIIDGVVQNSDKSRITSIEINKQKYGSDAQYAALIEAKKILTPENCAAFYWRVVSMAEIIKHNASVFTDVVGEIVNDSRAGEQLGAMLAGLISYHFDVKMTYSQAKKWISTLPNLSDYKAQYAEQDDATACLDAIMSYHIEHGDKKANIGDLCERAYRANTYDDDFKILNKSLAVYGLRIMEDRRLYVANKNERLKQLLNATPYSVGWDKVLTRLDGAVRTEKTISFFATALRAVSINIDDRFSD